MELPSLFMAYKALLPSPAHTTAKLIGVAAVLYSESDKHGRINKSPPFTFNHEIVALLWPPCQFLFYF